MLGQLRQRDARDASRADAPMIKADDAIELDTSDMSVDEAVREAIKLVDAKLG